MSYKIMQNIQGVPKKMTPRFIEHCNLIFDTSCEDNLIKLDTYTSLSMLNPSLNSDSTFCSQGVPKSPPILEIMKKWGLTKCGVFLLCLHVNKLTKLSTHINSSMLKPKLNPE